MRQSPLVGTEDRESMRKGRGRGGQKERTRREHLLETSPLSPAKK